MISIITPTHNRALLLSRMIESVIKQSFQNWELIIVDDGGTDNSEEIVCSYNDKRIKYFKKDNQGAGVARNFGVKKGKGEFIVFLDSDDEVKEHWLESFYERIKKEKAEIVCCGLIKIDPNGKELKILLPENLGPFFNDIIANYLAGSILMKKEYFEIIGGYDVKLSSGQHTDLFIRLSELIKRKSINISNIFETLVIVNIHEGVRIRHNYDAIYRGSTRTLKKYETLFRVNKQKHFDYLSVAGVNAIRTNRLKEGLKYLNQAIKVKPFDYKGYIRLLIGNIPFLRKKIW